MNHPIAKQRHHDGTGWEPKDEYYSHYGAMGVAYYLILLASVLLRGAFRIVIAIVMAAVLLGSRYAVGQVAFGQVGIEPRCTVREIQCRRSRIPVQGGRPHGRFRRCY